MIKSIIGGAAAAALLAGPALSAPPRTATYASTAKPAAMTVTWVVSPTETGCRVDLDLTGRSGAVTPVSLISDGQLVSLRFFKSGLPARAFLPIRIDRRPFSNLMLRGADGAGELVLSEDTEAAMKKGAVLGIAWLTEEPLLTPLAGSERGLSDLRVCGAQTAARHRDRAANEQAARDRAAAEARAKSLADAQLAAVQAQKAAAEAQRRTVEEAAARQRRADAEAAVERDRQAALYSEQADARAYQEARQRAYDAEAARRRAWEDARRQDQDDDPRWAPPPPRPYYYPPPQPRYPYPYSRY